MHLEWAWIWLALPPLLVWVWWLARRGYSQLKPAARWGSAGLRVLILVFLLAALSRPVWMRPTQGQHVLFLLDASRSISRENLEAALADIEHLASDAVGRGGRAGRGGNRVSIIAFGKQPRLLVTADRDWKGWKDEQRDMLTYETSLPQMHERMAKLTSEGAPAETVKELQKRIADTEAFRDQVAGEQTDARAAIRLALNTGAVQEAKTLYLFTDANFNRGDWREAYDAAAGLGHTINTVALDKPIPPEVAATDLTLPPSVRVNQSFSADLRIASTVETPAKIAVFRDGYASGEFSQTLKLGQNTVQIPALFFRDKGFHAIEVAVRAEKDTRVENNRVKALVVVPGELRVLYVDSDETQQSYLTSALGLEGVRVEARPGSGVPRALEELLGYDAFILCNVPADKLSAPQMQMIRTYVQDFGGGFIMLGGDQSFGLGGYYNTPVEEVLPVRMPIQKDLNRPSLAIILVIDKSGSMEGTKIQLAKRAAVATAEAINPRDQIGVVGFDSDAQTILELTPAADRGTINAKIAELDAGGGTFLYPGLEMAHDQLQQSPAKRKHVIILSDGQTQGFGYAEMAQMMAADSITISTVGIGEGADMKLMEQIAMAGAGRSYFTSDFHSIPQIFTREALRASNSMLIERLVVPSIAAEDECIGELDEKELPPLGGYVATTPKDTAKTIIISDNGDPILAKWRCGLGRTAAFTSDTKPKWAEDWIRWPEFTKFWAQLVRSVAGHEIAKDVSLETRYELTDTGVRLTAELRDAADNFVTDRTPELMLHEAQSGTKALVVEREAPGLFSAAAPVGEYGKTQQFAWRLPDAKGEGTTVPFGFVQSFSPEFRTLGVDEAVLEEIRKHGHGTGGANVGANAVVNGGANAGAGSVSRVGAVTLQLTPRSSTEQVLLWPFFLIGALGLVPVDILVRRLG